MLLLKLTGEFYLNKTKPLTENDMYADFRGLFVSDKRALECRCRKELLRTGVHEVILHRVGNFYEVVENASV